MPGEPLKPFGLDDAEPEADEAQGGYLWMAGVLCGLILAVGSQALLGHFAQRPELAAADPLMVQVMTVARWAGWILAAACLAGWIRRLGKV